MNTLKIASKTLPSGLDTIVVPRAEGQTVTFLVLIGVGSRYETPQQSGLSHFLEHMFFKGTTTRPTTKDISEAIDSVGGEFNAFTGEEYTGYYVKVAPDYLEHGADVVADILLRPLFDQTEIDRERGVITEEIRMYTDTPMRHIHHLWNQAQFGDHPLGRRIDGSEETVASFNRRDFVDYTSTHYHTGNAVVAVAGKCEVAPTRQLLKKLFAELPDGKATRPSAAPKQQPAERFVFEHRPELDQTHLMVGVPGVKLADKDRWAADVLATILGGGMSSRLFMSVRERRGLAYMVRTSSDQYTDTGSFVTQAGVRTDKAAEALKVILAEYDRVMTESVEERELDKAKQMLWGQMLISLEETNSQALFGGMQQLLRGDVKTPQHIMKQIRAVSVADVKRVAKRLLKPERRAAAMLGPQRSTAAFREQLGA